MKKFGKVICSGRVLILIIATLLLIPSLIGMLKTKISYDILTYLPESVETIQGENILTNDFNMGSYSIVILENMSNKEVLDLEDDLKKMETVELVGSIFDLIGEGYPVSMLPDEIKNKAFADDGKTTMLLVTFNDGISTDATMDTIENIRNITDSRCKTSGMSAVVLDTKILFNEEFAKYVVTASIICFVILELVLDSYVAPVFLLVNIGYAILYNMGSNIIFGEISYITKAVASVLQLGVTTDFAIFLYHSYIHHKKDMDKKEDAMAEAIAETMMSVFGSSTTTIAGFLALCTMELTLGKDIGLVMAKGVVFGVLCVITVLPAFLLCFDGLIEKTKHKCILPEFKHLKNFIMKNYILITVIFIIVLPIALYGYKNTKVYYNLDSKLPQKLESVQADGMLEEKFGLKTMEIVLLDVNAESEKVDKLIKEIEEMPGINWVLGLNKIDELGIPKMIIPNAILDKIQTDKYNLLLISTKYDVATDELNNQVEDISKVVNKYDEKAIISGVGPLMADLVKIADHDLKSVNIMSISIIFILMLVILASISLPFILIIVIEFAIFINMSIPFYTGEILPFIASIVIGTIQLGATIDYAILITSKYKVKKQEGLNKKDAIDYALGTSISSIIVSGLCFFGATIGVGIYSEIEIISSLCVLLARGAIISMISVIFVLPSFLYIFDGLISKTTIGLKRRSEK